MSRAEEQSGKLSVPDQATQREIMKLWRQVVELERKHNERKPPRDGGGTPPRR